MPYSNLNPIVWFNSRNWLFKAINAILCNLFRFSKEFCELFYIVNQSKTQFLEFLKLSRSTVWRFIFSVTFLVSLKGDPRSIRRVPQQTDWLVFTHWKTACATCASIYLYACCIADCASMLNGYGPLGSVSSQTSKYNCAFCRSPIH